MSILKTISPERAAELVRDGAVLVDVREADEYARERIPGARHHALAQIDANHPVHPGDEVLIFHCRSGNRTQANAERLAAVGSGCEVFILEGGIDAWKKMGLPTAMDRNQPIELIRQVQIAVGTIVVIAALLGALVQPGFYVISGLMGAGLMFAGVTGFCGMARLLGVMPWNRRALTPPSASS